MSLGINKMKFISRVQSLSADWLLKFQTFWPRRASRALCISWQHADLLYPWTTHQLQVFPPKTPFFHAPLTTQQVCVFPGKILLSHTSWTTRWFPLFAGSILVPVRSLYLLATLHCKKHISFNLEEYLILTDCWRTSNCGLNCRKNNK